MCALSTLLTRGNSEANSCLRFAELAQLVERRLAKAKVAGSNPVFRSKYKGSVFHGFDLGAGPSGWGLAARLDPGWTQICHRLRRQRDWHALVGRRGGLPERFQWRPQIVDAQVA